MYNVSFIGIGTNKGDRKNNINYALKLLSSHSEIRILKVSDFLKNPPQEGIKSGYFLNGAIKLATTLSPLDLLKLCKNIERQLGRRQRIEARGKKQEARIKKPRTIDLDILLYGSEIINSSKLTIPHPRLHKRYFVLIPLMEIGKSVIHPVFKKTVQELYDGLNYSSKRYA